MHEDLDQIARLKFGKEIESISTQTREKVKEMQNKYAALTGSSGVRSGEHEVSIGRVQIAGAEQLVRALYQIWLNLIEQQKSGISRPDIAFIAGKIDDYARIQMGHLHAAFSQQRAGEIVNLLTEEAGMRMHAVAADVRRDLKIKALERETFPSGAAAEKDHSMATSIHLHIENSSVANLNLGSQVGTINTALEAISEQPGSSQRELVLALKQFTEATVGEKALVDKEKQEIVQALSALAEQAAKKPEERSKGPVRAIVSWLPTAITAATDLTTLWDKFGPSIKAYFGI